MIIKGSIKGHKYYTLGCTLYSTEHINPIEGLYVFGKFGLPYITKNLKEEDHIYLTEDFKEAKKLAQFYARIYREEYRGQVKRGKHFQNGRFYVLKLREKIIKNKDIVEIKTTNLNKSKTVKFYGDADKIKIVKLK